MRGKHPPCQSLEQTLLMPNPWATTRCAALIDGPHRPPHQPWALPRPGAGWATAVPAKTLSSDTFRTSSKSEGKHQWEVPQAPCPLVGQSWRTVCEDFKGLQWDWAPVGQSGDCSWHMPVVSAHLPVSVPYSLTMPHGMTSRPAMCFLILMSVPASTSSQAAKDLVQISDCVKFWFPQG